MIGTTISHYRIVEELGKGGMGIVYRADDVTLGRPVALKLLASHMLASESDRKRFYREARAAAALNHPNIATVYEIGETEDGCPFIAMEIIEIETAWLLQRHEFLRELLASTRIEIEGDRESNGNFRNRRSWLSMGLVEAASGNTAEAEQMVRRYQREVASDWAERTAHRHESCRILAIAGAVDATVECLRLGLVGAKLGCPVLRTAPSFL